MTSLRARPATLSDVPRITGIYNQGIADRVATFETEPRTEEMVRGWFDTGYPIIVLEGEGSVIAWAAASLYRPRACYAGNAEFSVYVDRDSRGQGAGRIVMQAFIDASRDAGLNKLVSRVFVENSASRKLLRSLGFREVGVYERHAQLDGVWRDVVIVERLLQHIITDAPYGALWQPDLMTLDVWPEIASETDIILEKVPWEPDRTPYRYPARVVATDAPEPWIETEAVWTLGVKDLAGLVCEPGNIFREFFSPHHPFNCFAMYTPCGEFVGWYGNVTRPTRCFRSNDELVVSWPDLILDLVMLPDGTVTDLDDDELAESGWPESQPELTRQMIAARDELRRLLQAGFFPTR